MPVAPASPELESLSLAAAPDSLAVTPPSPAGVCAQQPATHSSTTGKPPLTRGSVTRHARFVDSRFVLPIRQAGVERWERSVA